MGNHDPYSDNTQLNRYFFPRCGWPEDLILRRGARPPSGLALI